MISLNVTVTPSALSGKVNIPSSKSEGHRLLMAAAFSDGESRLYGMSHSEDIDATIGCMRRMGAEIIEENGVMTVKGIAAKENCLIGKSLGFDCRESGSTLRFLIPAAAVLSDGARFEAKGRLPKRPQKPYEEIFQALGGEFLQDDGGLTLKGNLSPAVYKLRGDTSSQFFTGLMYALPLLSGKSEIISTTALESSAYIDMTISAMQRAGVEVKTIDNGHWLIEGNQGYRPFEKTVEGDWSQAAFWLSLNFIGANLEIIGLSADSLQGDRAIADMTEKMKADCDVTIDLSECPDLLPPAAASAALRKKGSVTHFVGARRLRIKESDRIASVNAALAAMGAETIEGEDFLTIFGAGKLKGGCVIDSANDHRIAMMAAIATAGCEEPVTITGAECVKKSYPDFWEVYKSVGGIIAVEGV